MQKPRTLRIRLLAAAAFALVILPAGVPAHAVAKEIVELQTQVQQLMDMVQRLQSTMDSHFGALQNLAQQTADQANQMTAAVNSLQQKLTAQEDALSGKLDTSSGQVQSLNDSVDELKSRIAKLDKTVQDMQAQLQTIQSPPTTAPPAGSSAPGGAMPPPQAGGDASQPSNAPPSGPAPVMSSTAPPLKDTFQSGVRDYNSANYQVAAGEFQDVVHYYPLDDLAGTAQFYLGEIAYQKQDYPTAINAYNAVLEGFSGNAKAPAAQLHKGLALLAEDKKDAGVRELRTLIQRHPQTPEAARARTKLNAMGIRITPR